MKLKFGHIADTHIGHYSGKVEKGGINARFIDFVKTYNQSIDRMIADKMDFCLIPGDIFRTKKPGPEELDAFAEGILKLVKAEIPAILTLGNHDVFLYDGGTHSFSVVDRMFDFIKKEKLASIKDDSFILSSKPEIITLDIRGQKIQIQTMPYPVRSLLRLETKEAVEKYMVEKVNEVYESRDKNIPIVFAGHFSISEALIGGEQINFDKFSEPLMSKEVFVGKDYKYVAMGHLHQYQVVSENPLIVYCGSNNRVDFNEADEPKGFVEVLIDDTKTKHRFIDVEARKFIDLKYDLSEENEPTEKIMSSITDRIEEIKEAIVRVIVTVSSKNRDKYDDEQVSDFLNKYCYHIHGTTIPTIKRETDARNISGFVESMDVFSALRHYASVRNISNKEDFIKLGEGIVKKTRGGD